jgi:hypothetical protein
MNKKILNAGLISIALVASMASCGKTVSATAYGVINGDCIASVAITAYKGKVTSCKIDETFAPCYWARIDLTKVTETPVTIDLDIPTYAGSTTMVAVHFAKYIALGGYIYEGQEETDTALTGEGEYVTYTAMDTAKAPSGTSTWFQYVSASDSNGNLGTKAGWYFNCMKSGNYSALAFADVTKTIPTAALNIPGSLFKADEACTYWPEDDTNSVMGWKGNIAKIEKYFVGTAIKPLSGSTGTAVVEQGNDKIWTVDTVTTGATITNFATYYQIANWAFAKIEYSSYGM